MHEETRLRQHPHERLTGSVQHIDLAAKAAQLRAEPHTSKNGHRQVALARHGALAQLLFVFEPDGELKTHRTDGEVTIHTLSGELVVTLEDGPRVMTGGQLLCLAGNVQHSVRATTASEMLLTICHHARA
jgi:quercetin dioxygenase-like cupin family protein